MKHFDGRHVVLALLAAIACSKAGAVMLAPGSAPAAEPVAEAAAVAAPSPAQMRDESHTRVAAVLEAVDVRAGTLTVAGQVLRFAPDMKVYSSAGSVTNAYALGKGSRVWLQFEGSSVTARPVRAVWLQ